MTQDPCPNCGSPIQNENLGCLLHDLIQVIRERGNKTEDELLALHRDCDADGLWNHLGKIVDRLEDGFYTLHW